MKSIEEKIAALKLDKYTPVLEKAARWSYFIALVAAPLIFCLLFALLETVCVFNNDLENTPNVLLIAFAAAFFEFASLIAMAFLLAAAARLIQPLDKHQEAQEKWLKDRNEAVQLASNFLAPAGPVLTASIFLSLVLCSLLKESSSGWFVMFIMTVIISSVVYIIPSASSLALKKYEELKTIRA